ncbi:MAG: caspase family protein [Acidobacteriota bacterium]|nr:caspase family protein [Acidobacteriota bacterium]
MPRVLLIFALVSSILAQDRGVKVRVRDAQGQTRQVKLYDASYALVVGASDYDKGWNKLGGVKGDIAAVKAILVKHGFEVEEFLNPTSENFLQRINQFVNKYGFGENNRLLIYFAGHGYTETGRDGRKFGYIVPVDAPDPTKNLIGFGQKALTMDEIETVARRIRSKHALFVFDSCFSGSLVSRSKTVVPPIISYLSAQPVRQFITSGADNQEVPDESVFRQMFVRGLEGDADANKDGYITGTELAIHLQEKVIYYRGDLQTPQYGKIRDPKLDKGDFIFVGINSAISNQSIIENLPNINDAPIRVAPPNRGKKSGKILFSFGYLSGVKLTTDKGLSLNAVFTEPIISKLKERNLTILSMNSNDLTEEERSQYFGGINYRNDEKALRLLPVALIFGATINSIEDLPQYQELFISKLSGHFEIIDTDNNKTISSERFDEVRGFGNTQEQARRNALKTAAEGISESFLNLVRDKSK